jgi:hypothetical protein
MRSYFFEPVTCFSSAARACSCLSRRCRLSARSCLPAHSRALLTAMLHLPAAPSRVRRCRSVEGEKVKDERETPMSCACGQACTGYDAPQGPRWPVAGDEDRLAAVLLWLLEKAQNCNRMKGQSELFTLWVGCSSSSSLDCSCPACLSRARPSSARHQPLSAAVPPWFPPSWRGGPPCRLA